ncbi:hypothetical protein ACHAWF_007929 [Thalassiosira exigua]
MSRCPATYQHFPLTLLSWNISNAHPSSAAPDVARRSTEAPRLIRDECLRPSPRPDVLALQECPHPHFGREEFGPSGYVSMGTRQSHCGFVDLLVREELASRSAAPIAMPGEGLPSVAAAIELPDRTRVAVSSSHLAPFKENAFVRKMQCEALMELMDGHVDNAILLGDFNMRAAEDRAIEDARGGGWIDAWKGAGSEKGTKFSWNSFANSYHEGGFRFRARFDRCYLRGGALHVSHFDLLGNEPVEGKKGDYLSDHFGLLVRLEVSNGEVVQK